MNKAVWRCCGTAAMLVLVFCGSAAAQISVVVNGQPVSFPDQQPTTIDNRTLVPLRGVLEALGARVDWNPGQQSVTATRGGTTVQLAVGSRDASVNGAPVSLDVPAMLIGGRVMVPLRFVSEALGAQVGWMEATQTVNIQSSAPVNAAVGARPADGGLTGQGANFGSVGGRAAPPNGLQAAGAPAGRGAPAPVSRDVVVTNFALDQAGPFHAGQEITATMTGTPGGHAFFTLLGSTVQMKEAQPGVYTGTFRVPANAHAENVAVVGRLEKDGASSPLVQAANAVTIAALPPAISQQEPALGAVVSNVRPTIYALFTPGSSPVNPGTVRLWVNGEDVTAAATVTPNFVAYTPQAPLPAGAVNVKVQVGDTTDNTRTAEWAFTVKPQEGIKSLVDNAAKALGPGDVLTVNMTGEPGGQAWFSIPGVNERVPMTETAPGQYTGTYTVRRGDDVVGQKIVGHLSADGAQFSENISAPVTLWTKGAMQPVITSPAAGAKVGGSIQVTGTADPDASVEITVTYQQTVLGIFSTGGNVATETVTADRAGHFQTPIIPIGGVFGTSGVNYTITAVETNPAGQKSEPAVVHVRS